MAPGGISALEQGIECVCVDSADPSALAAWWQRLLGGEAQVDGDGDVALQTAGIRLLFLAVPDSKRGKNRLHIDLRATNFNDAVQGALAIGAQRADDVHNGPRWQVLRDPEGNEFCILRPRQDAERQTDAGQFRPVSDTDDIVEHILKTYGTITVVGASSEASKAADSVPAHMQQHGWRIVPVNPHAEEILGEPVYRSLADVPEPIGLVDVFRPSPATPDVARQAAAAGAEALWLQLGIRSEEARSIAQGAGMLYVEDRCLIIEQRRLGLDAPA